MNMLFLYFAYFIVMYLLRMLNYFALGASNMRVQISCGIFIYHASDPHILVVCLPKGLIMTLNIQVLRF
jgi:hypothetical protein